MQRQHRFPSRVVPGGERQGCAGEGQVPQQVPRRPQRQQSAPPRVPAPPPQVVAGGGGARVEHGEGVDDEAGLLVREERVEEDECQRGEGQSEGPSLEVYAERDQGEREAESAREAVAEVPRPGLGAPSGALVQDHVVVKDLQEVHSCKKKNEEKNNTKSPGLPATTGPLFARSMNRRPPSLPM